MVLENENKLDEYIPPIEQITYIKLNFSRRKFIADKIINNLKNYFQFDLYKHVKNEVHCRGGGDGIELFVNESIDFFGRKDVIVHIDCYPEFNREILDKAKMVCENKGLYNLSLKS